MYIYRKVKITNSLERIEYTGRRLNCSEEREVDRLDGMDSLAYGYWRGRCVLWVRDQQG
jgi:hypothetical protein